MTDLEELRRLRPAVAGPAPEALARAGSALTAAIARERKAPDDKAIPVLVTGHPITEGGELQRTVTPSAWRARLIAAACAVVLATAATVTSLVWTAGGHSRPASDGQHSRSTVPAPTPAATSIVLAGYRFSLPAGFKTVASSCVPPVPVSGIHAVTVLGALAAAASSSGGCVEMELTGGAYAVPSEAQPVAVGSYQGFLLGSSSPDDEVLYVAIPAAVGDHYLVVWATGLTSDQLIAMVADGLPGSAGTTTTCTANCG